MHRHYWLEIGADRLIFDPTAHQFDDRGGVQLDRYTAGGEPLRPRGMSEEQRLRESGGFLLIPAFPTATPSRVT